MAFAFTVLASGSSGNACLLEMDGFGLLLDAGLGPRQIARRLQSLGLSWHAIQAVLLTHTHGDHWKETTLVHLARRRVPLYCHAEHHDALRAGGLAFTALHTCGLVRGYEEGVPLELAPGLRCLPLPVRHDSGATFGFRFEGRADLYGRAVALGYAADLGTWTPALAQALANVDLLALEFNHDPVLEQTSGRSPWLIARVLGEEGHLSNLQAAALLREVLRCSEPGRLRTLVQLHLSRDCNRPGLAAEVARQVVADLDPPVHIETAFQDMPTPRLLVGEPAAGQPARRPRAPRRSPAVTTAPPWFPGWMD